MCFSLFCFDYESQRRLAQKPGFAKENRPSYRCQKQDHSERARENPLLLQREVRVSVCGCANIKGGNILFYFILFYLILFCEEGEA